MIKLNNKGFAISAVVYGLAIMGVLIVAILMRTVSSTRENQRELSDMIEKELNNLGMTANAYTPVTGGEAQVFTAQDEALYKIELWGAAGNNGTGGKGSYTSGVIKLKAGEKLYFFVGASSATGGQETDVRVISNGGYTGHDSYETRIMVAGGGGKTGDARGLVRSDSLALIPPTGSNGGGDGYIPGTSEAEGGSSFISGQAGSQAIIKGVPELNNPTYNYYELKSYDTIKNEYEYGTTSKKYYFIDGMIIPGVNAGGGKAVIKKINGQASSIKTTLVCNDGTKITSLKAKTITVCNSNGTAFASAADAKVFAIGDITSATDTSDTGGLILTNPTNGSNGSGCIVNSLTTEGKTKNIDEIVILDLVNTNTYNVTIEPVSGSKIELKNIKPSSQGEIRISSYQPHGTITETRTENYYITTVESQNRFLTAESGNTTRQLLSGNRNQIWEITKIDDSKYKIVEMSKYLALELDATKIVPDTSKIICNNSFSIDEENPNQLFLFYPNSDGTFRITPYNDSGNIYALIFTDAGLKVTTKNENDDRQKFKMIAIDYINNK